MDNSFKLDTIEFRKKENKLSITKTERRWRNHRERRRMKKLSEAFTVLAMKLPSYIRRGKDFKKLRKLEILCMAIEYMKLLNEELKNGNELYNKTDLISYLDGE